MSHSPEKIAAWLERLFGNEGEYVNDHKDPGGETKWGISKRSYPELNIAETSKEEAAEIYVRDFLEPLDADKLEDGIVFQLLDFAANSGQGVAIRKLQQALGVADDGIIGEVTLGAVRMLSESDLIMLVLSERIMYLTKLKNWPHHGKGWMRRIAKNLKYGAEDSE